MKGGRKIGLWGDRIKKYMKKLKRKRENVEEKVQRENVEDAVEEINYINII